MIMHLCRDRCAVAHAAHLGPCVRHTRAAAQARLAHVADSLRPISARFNRRLMPPSLAVVLVRQEVASVQRALGLMRPYRHITGTPTLRSS